MPERYLWQGGVMTDFLTLIATNGDKFSLRISGIAYIHWGGLTADGDLVETDIYVFGRKQAIVSIDHRLPENQRSLSKIIPVAWEYLTFDEENKN